MSAHADGVEVKHLTVDRPRWLNRTVLGIGLASLLSDWSHEIATTIMPAILAAIVSVFVIGGIYVAIEQSLEDSLTAELVTQEHHGIGFGVLATVNGIGGFLSSLIVGLFWTAVGTQAAFAYCSILFAAGAALVRFWK